MKSLLLCVGILIASTAESDGRSVSRMREPALLIKASSIHLGVKKPGVFSPGNLFDGDASTSYCGAPGQPASVSFAARAMGPDEENIRRITHVEVAGGANATGSRTVTIRLSYVPGSGRHKFKTASAVLNGSESISIPLTLPDNAIAIHVNIGITPEGRSKRKRATCLSEVAFQRGPNLISLPALAKAVQEGSARYKKLATAETRKMSTETYLTQHRWIRFHPDKRVSTWESATYEFFADNSFVRQNNPNRLNPVARTGTWRVTKNGLVVITGDDLRRFRLVPCRFERGYLCVNKVAMRPTQTF